MPTFKAIVRKHHQRRDGKYPVSIRVTHNRQSAYLPTGLYVEKRGINTRTFEIKDQFIIERANKTIRNYEERLLMLDTEELLQMSITALISLLRASSGRIDYFSMCDEIIAQNKEKEQALAHALNIIKNEMGIMRMYSTDFTSHFLREFKRHLDNRDIITVRKDGKETRRKMAAKTKNSYLKAVCKAFRMMCKEYNTEFVQVIKHNPFIGFELYPEPQTKRKALDVKVLRKIFNCDKKLSPLQQQTLDIMRMEFCLCGMNTKDLLTVTKGCYDAKANRISYERSKTRESRNDRAFTSVRIEPEIQDLFNKYKSKSGERLFDFGSMKDVNNTNRKLGTYLYAICDKLEIARISPYWFRHTWATIARNKCGASKDDVDLCLVHKGLNPMADVYIDPDYSIIDSTNRRVLDYVFGVK